MNFVNDLNGWSLFPSSLVDIDEYFLCPRGWVAAGIWNRGREKVGCCCCWSFTRYETEEDEQYGVEADWVYPTLSIIRLVQSSNRGSISVDFLTVFIVSKILLTGIVHWFWAILDPCSQRTGSYKFGAVIVNV